MGKHSVYGEAHRKSPVHLSYCSFQEIKIHGVIEQGDKKLNLGTQMVLKFKVLFGHQNGEGGSG